MSIISPILSFFGIGPSRSFAGISGYVTLTENTTDALEITQQPVQQGAAISDHAFKKPVNLSIQIKFAASGLGAILGSNLQQTYAKLLQLQVPQANAQGNYVLSPFTVVTPKRSYPNMLLATIGLVTDKTTENALAITCSFQEVLIVNVSTALVNPSQLKNPGSNQGTQNTGAHQSALFSLFG